MADQLLKEDGDGLLLETGDALLLEDPGAVQAGSNTITFTAPTVGLAIPAGAQTITLTAPAVALGIAAGAQTITFTAPAVTVSGLFRFQHLLVVRAPLAGSAYRFRHQLQVIHLPLPAFRHTLAIRGVPGRFRHHLRILPGIQALFAEDIQRPVGRVEEQ